MGDENNGPLLFVISLTTQPQPIQKILCDIMDGQYAFAEGCICVITIAHDSRINIRIPQLSGEEVSQPVTIAIRPGFLIVTPKSMDCYDAGIQY